LTITIVPPFETIDSLGFIIPHDTRIVKVV